MTKVNVCCCCRRSAVDVARVIAILCIVTSILTIGSSIYTNEFISLPLSVASIVSSVILFIATIKRKSSLFWPFIIVNAILILNVIFQVGRDLLFAVCVFTDANIMDFSEDQMESIRKTILFFISIDILTILFCVWCEYVVIKAYKSVSKTPSVPQPGSVNA